MKLLKVRQCIGLLSSMVYCGEEHSEQSKILVAEALIELHDAENEFASRESSKVPEPPPEPDGFHDFQGPIIR